MPSSSKDPKARNDVRETNDHAHALVEGREYTKKYVRLKLGVCVAKSDAKPAGPLMLDGGRCGAVCPLKHVSLCLGVRDVGWFVTFLFLRHSLQFFLEMALNRLEVLMLSMMAE